MHAMQTESRVSGPQFEDLVRKNLQIVEDYVDFDAYNVWIPAGDFIIDKAGAGLAVLENTTISAPAWSFPDGTDDSVAFSIRRPRQWQNGKVSCRIYYSALGAGEDAIAGVSLYAINEGVAFPAHAYVDFTIAADATQVLKVNRTREVSADAGSQIDVNQTHMLIGVGFQITGSSPSHTLANRFYLLGLELFYREKNHSENHLAINPDYRHVNRP